MESDKSDDDNSYNLPDFMPPTRVIMNRNRIRRNDLSEATEMRIFRELFGTRLLVVENLWFLLVKLSLHPEGGLPKHLFWVLHFMKAYTLQAQGCAAVGGSGGAVDPKTYQKWVLEPCPKGTYVTYPYLGSHCDRVLVVIRYT